MLNFTNSDLFNKYINRDNVVMGRVNSILNNLEPGTVILNQILFPDIKRKILDRRKEPSFIKMGNAIMEGRIVLFALPPDKNLYSSFPFFVYSQKGIRKVAINLTNIVNKTKDVSGNMVYDIGDNVNKLYVVLYSAYLALDVFLPNAALTPDTLYMSAILWANMFIKPIYATYGMNNLDRNKAFLYFSMKFFLGYYMECPEKQIEELTMKYIGKKNDFILGMEEAIQRKGYNLYEGFIPFCQILFDNEVTMIKGVRVNNVASNMNVTTYIKDFSVNYHSNSLMALCAYPYFIYVLIAASTKCGLVKDKAFDRIFKDEGNVFAKLMVAILK